ncbi:hypothetical protein [Haliea sp. E17]|uniref:hypothetical protein n=1 Tax=Haliea sp. E17 TaxID=3401576 RepID=UPI003AB02C22
MVALSLGSTTLAQPTVVETEPNNTPAEAQPISGAVKLYGSMVGKDQDGFLWTVSDNDARKHWDFELHGIPGALTIVEVVRVENTEDGTGVASVERIMKMGTRDGVTPSIHRNQLFEPGEYLIGLAHAGGPAKGGGAYRPPAIGLSFGSEGSPEGEALEAAAGDGEAAAEENGAWQFLISEGDSFPVSRNPGPRETQESAQSIIPGRRFSTFESLERTWYAFTFDEQKATQRWDIEVRAPLGRKLRVRLVDSEGKELLQDSADSHGRVLFSDLAPPPGTWYLELVAAEPGFIHAVSSRAAGQRIEGEEAEPNNQGALANRVDLVAQPVTGRIDRSDSADIFRFTLDEASADQVLALRVDGTPAARMQICIYDDQWTTLQCRDGTTPLELPDLVLPPGDWGVGLQRADETNWTLSLHGQGPITPGREAEPNDNIDNAAAVPEGQRIKGRFTGQDRDYYRFQIPDKAQMWRFQVIGDNIHEVNYYNGAGEKRGGVRTEAGQRRVRLDDLFLLPGTHHLQVSARRGDEGGEYTVLARPLGPPDPDGELEENDNNNRQRLAFDQTRKGLVTNKSDSDNYRFFLANDDHIKLELQPPADGHLWMDLYWYGETVGNGRPLAAGEPLVIDGLFPPGDYQLKITAVQPSDAEYSLSLQRQPRFSCPTDCEPNGIGKVHMAAPLPADLLLQGRSGDWRDWDYYQLPVFDTDVELQMQTAEELGGVALGPYYAQRKPLRFDRELPGYRATLPAGEANRLMLDSRNKDYRLQLVFPGGELVPTGGEPTLDIALSLPAEPVSAYQWTGQRLAAELTISNTGSEAIDSVLEVATSDHRWQVNPQEQAVTLQPGETRAIPVTVRVPADAWAGRPVRISAAVRDASGRQVETWQEIEPQRAAPPLAPEYSWPIADSLRGGFNAAWTPFGGDWSGDIAHLVRPEFLRDDLVFDGTSAALRSKGRCDGGDDSPLLTLELPGTDPLPVAGVGLNFFGGHRPFLFIRRATLLLSMDGENYEEVMSFAAQPVLTEQSFAIGRTVNARFARLRIDANWEEASRCEAIELSEWKVILEPGFDLSAGAGFDIARPELGGHVVWENPESSGPEDILLDDGKARNIKADAGGVKDFVIGFNRNRAAQVSRIEWLNREGQPASDHHFDHLTVSASLESPAGPWVVLGESALAPGREGAVIDLAQPAWARFVRLSARFVEGARGGFQPDVIRIHERPTAADYRSVLTEWGDTNYRAFYEWQAGLPEAPAEPVSGNDSRARAAALAPGDSVGGEVSLNRKLEHWYRLQLPAGHNTLTLALGGSPTVRTVLAMEDAEGLQVPLRRVDDGKTLDQHRYEAALAPGSEAWLRVSEPPRNVVFSWDTSPSVASMIPRIRNALVAFSSQVVPGREAVNLMPFPHGPLLRDWLGEPYMLQTVLNEFDRGLGSSAAMTTLKKASAELAPRPGTKAIMVITDGETTADGKAWTELRKARPRVFAVQVAGNKRWHLDVMRDWASIDAGHFNQLRYEGEMEIAFDRAATLMRRPAGYTLQPSSEFREAPGPGQLLVLPGDAGNTASGGTAIELILDASGSMLQRVDGKRRIAIAREVLTDAVRKQIPAGTPLALRVFGHREIDSCRTDLEIPLAPLDPAAAANTIGGIQAMNLARTPIADSLAAVETDLQGRKSSVVILVTDGEETCEGDPAAVIEALRDKGFDVNLNIVGFAIGDPELASQFESWAALGNGRYYAADNREGLQDALEQALRVPYRVLDGNGNEVASGQVGGPPVELEAGYYDVVVATEPPRTFDQVEIPGESAVELKLD